MKTRPAINPMPVKQPTIDRSKPAINPMPVKQPPVDRSKPAINPMPTKPLVDRSKPAVNPMPTAWQANSGSAKAVETALKTEGGMRMMAELLENHFEGYQWNPDAGDAAPGRWALSASEIGEASYHFEVKGNVLSVESGMSDFSAKVKLRSTSREDLNAGAAEAWRLALAYQDGA